MSNNFQNSYYSNSNVSQSKKMSKKKSKSFISDQIKDKINLQTQLKQDFSDIIDDYELISYLGKGSYGIVAKGIHRLTKQTFAIKKYLNLYRDKIDTKRVLREIAILRQLQHLNLVKLFDMIIPNQISVENVYVVVELCDTDLKSFLYKTEKYLTENQIKKIMLDILNGLEYMHKCGVIDRDLKPANIVMNQIARLRSVISGLRERLLWNMKLRN